MYFIAQRESFAEIDFHAFGCLGTPLDMKKKKKQQKYCNTWNIEL